MAKSNEQILDEQQRLLAIREFLRVHARPDDPHFGQEVAEAAILKVQPILLQHADGFGEDIIAAVAQHQGVRFEDVRNHDDIAALEQKYLVEQRELGFGMLKHELSDSSVDALLFQRMHAEPEAPDRWIAVLNLQETESRAYWSRTHELIHRLAEPPQRRLPFFRHRTDRGHRVEEIIDLGAAELAFPVLVFAPRVQVVSHQALTWDLVRELRQQFAPTASLESAVRAVLRFWPQPAFLIKAEYRPRKGTAHKDLALRVSIEGFSPAAEVSGVRFFPNMRVPPTSAIWGTFFSRLEDTEFEKLENWTTSQGKALPDRQALTSAIPVRDFVYALISLPE